MKVVKLESTIKVGRVFCIIIAKKMLGTDYRIDAQKNAWRLEWQKIGMLNEMGAYALLGNEEMKTFIFEESGLAGLLRVNNWQYTQTFGRLRHAYTRTE